MSRRSVLFDPSKLPVRLAPDPPHLIPLATSHPHPTPPMPKPPSHPLQHEHKAVLVAVVLPPKHNLMQTRQAGAAAQLLGGHAVWEAAGSDVLIADAGAWRLGVAVNDLAVKVVFAGEVLERGGV